MVSTTLTLAVVNDVPAAKVGLASGMLTMTWQVGIALGVAVRGSAYLHHVHAELLQQLGSLPYAQLAQIPTAAEHIVPLGHGEARSVVEGMRVKRSDRIPLAMSISCGLTTISAALIRRRQSTRETGNGAQQQQQS